MCVCGGGGGEWQNILPPDAIGLRSSSGRIMLKCCILWIFFVKKLFIVMGKNMHFKNKR